MSVIGAQLQRSWIKVSSLLQIESEEEYESAVKRLNGLVAHRRVPWIAAIPDKTAWRRLNIWS